MARVVAMVRGRPTLAFYWVVLGSSLAGATTSAERWLQWPTPVAGLVVAAVELGGVVLSIHADRRRELGENAVWARALSAGIAAGAVATQWFGHYGPQDHQRFQAAFFAGLSLLGYLVYLLDSAARRRDALRGKGRLDDPPPVYGVWQWLSHPRITNRARLLAQTNAAARLAEVADKPDGAVPSTPLLGRLASLEAAIATLRAEAREAAIATELRERIKAAAGDTMAAIAVHTYDLDQVAKRLAERADYDGLTDLLAADLTAAKLTGKETAEPAPVDDLTAVMDVTAPTLDEKIEAAVSRFVVTPGTAEVDVTEVVTTEAEPVIDAPEVDATVTPAKPPADVKTPVKRARPKALTSAEKVARAAAKLPGGTLAQIAAKAGVSESTARRHLPASVPSPSGADAAETVRELVGSVNGHNHTQED